MSDIIYLFVEFMFCSVLDNVAANYANMNPKALNKVKQKVAM